MGHLNVIIYGIGGLSELVSAFLKKESDYKICGYCIDSKHRNDLDSFNDTDLIDFEKVVGLFPPSEYSLFIAIGNNYAREQIFSEAKKKGYSMISHITQSVLCWDDIKIGENVLISGSTSIQPFVNIGDNSFIMGSKIGHHCKIGNHALLSCTTLGGKVTVGDYSFLGLNSAVQQKTNIAERNIIGMGCCISRSTKTNEVYTNTGTAVKRNVSADQIKESFL